MEPNVFDHSFLDAEVHPDHVPAQRVVLFVADVRVVETAEVPRVLVVVEDVLAVKLVVSGCAAHRCPPPLGGRSGEGLKVGLVI
jgi:hypothetical protein